MKTLNQIKKETRLHKGLYFTATQFKYAFKLGMKELNELLSEGYLNVTGKTNGNNLIYEVV